MKCVIVAAGMGTRLRPLTRNLPKCLLPLGGKTLIERTIGAVLANGIREIAIVTGYQEQKVRQAVTRAFPRLSISFISNRKFRATNNAVSLFLAGPFVRNSSFLLLDSDILFSAPLLDSLLAVQRKPNRIAVRVSGYHDAEEIRVRINRWDHILAIGKDIPMNETYGESVGLEIFSAEASEQLFPILERRLKSAGGRKEFYEAAFQELIDGGTRLWAIDVSAFPVVEIDTPDDLETAQRMVLNGGYD